MPGERGQVERGGLRAGRFFAHRRITPDTLECERRVAAIPGREMARANAESRGQSLAAFQAVLPRMISLERIAFPLGTVEEAHAGLLAIPGAPHLADRLVQAVGAPENRDPGRIARMAEHALASIDRNGAPLSMGLSQALQRRIATGLYAHMLVPQSRPTLAFAVRHAMLVHSHTLARLGPAGTDPGRFGSLLAVYGVLSLRDAGRARTRIASLGRPGPAGGGLSPLGHVASMVEVDLMSLLCRLPYREMMANLARKRDPLDGIEPCVRTMVGVAPAGPSRAVRAAMAGDAPPQASPPAHLLSFRGPPRAGR